MKYQIELQTNLDLPRGEGEKKLLREVAILLGCPSAAGLPKRAIQFGTRIANLSNIKKCKGSDQSDTLVYQ